MANDGFSVEFIASTTGTKLETLLAKTFAAKNKAAAFGKFVDGLDKTKRITLAGTSKFYWQELKGVFKNNRFGWPKQREYSNWFGKFGAVNISGLTAANRPKKRLTKAGNVRKRGYSRTSAIKPPKETPLGGRLGGLMSRRFDVDKGTMVVGLRPDAVKKQPNNLAQIFSDWQDGGTATFGNSKTMQNYLAAIGIWTKKRSFKRPARKVIEPLTQQYPVEQIFNKKYEESFGKR